MNADLRTLSELAFDPQSVNISEAKIRKYLLDLTHPEGGPKAKFFLARGFSDGEWHLLSKAIKRHPIDNAIEEKKVTKWGMKFMVRCVLKTPDGRNPCILTVWMMDGPGPARFVTAYPGRD